MTLVLLYNPRRGLSSIIPRYTWLGRVRELLYILNNFKIWKMYETFLKSALKMYLVRRQGQW